MSDNNSHPGKPLEMDAADIEIVEEVNNGAKRRKLDEIQKRPVPNFATLQSKVYLQFTWKDEDRQWKCSHCDKQYTHGSKGGSASLMTHLKSKHPSILQVLDIVPEKGIDLTQYLKVVPKPASNPATAPPITEDGFKERLIRLFVETDQPFVRVEHPAFTDFVGYCTQGNIKAKLPKKDAFQNRIRERFNAEKANLIDVLRRNESKVSFILDCWTSSNQKPFQGVIGCWINDKWELCQTVLDLTILEGEHSGAALAEAFGGVLDSFTLWDKMQAVTSDNASNLDTMFRHLDEMAQEKLIDFTSKDNRVRCLAHIINLSCKDIIDCILASKNGTLLNSNQILDESDNDMEEQDEDGSSGSDSEVFLVTLRKAIRGIRCSTQRREFFEKSCPKFGLPYKMLELDVSTRWNSTVRMLRLALKYKKPMLATLQHDRKLRRLELTDESEIWQKCAELIKLLEPFEEATIMLSQGHSPTLSDTATVFLHLFDHLENYTKGGEKKLLKTRSRTRVENLDNQPSWLIEGAQRGWDKLQKYYKYNDNLVYVIATVLDPRYKLDWFKVSWEKTFVDAVKKKLTEVWNKYKSLGEADARDASLPSSSSKSSSNIASLLAVKMQQFHRSDDELKRYLSEPVTNPTMESTVKGALEWWKVHQADFPQLSKVARDFLAVSATGVPVERLFSTGPDLLSPKRQRMNSSTIQECMCLKQWLKCKGILYSIDNMQEAIKEKLGIEDDDEDKE